MRRGNGQFGRLIFCDDIDFCLLWLAYKIQPIYAGRKRIICPERIAGFPSVGPHTICPNVASRKYPKMPVISSE
jgi:hypothetical protein